MAEPPLAVPPSKDNDRFDDWLFRLYRKVTTGYVVVGAWLTSGITGTASKIPAFDSSGVATELTESGTGSVAMTTSAVLTTPNIGTPSAGTLTSCTGLPISTGVSGLATNMATFLATPNSANLRATVTDETGTSGGLVFAGSPTLTTPNIGAATGTSLAATGAITSTGTAGVGYASGAGSAVTQTTSKAQGVTINTICGRITMNAAALAAATAVAFTVSNSACGDDDVVVLSIDSTGTVGSYLVSVGQVNNSSFSITLYNCSAGSLSQAVVINFAIIKSVQS